MEYFAWLGCGCFSAYVKLITKISLATGARWGEVEVLTIDKLQDGKLTFTKTKSGKNRSIPVSPGLFSEVKEHLKKIWIFFQLYQRVR